MKDITTLRAPQGSRGRVIQVHGNQVTLRNQNGIFSFNVLKTSSVSIGDIVEIKDQNAVVLTPNSTPNKSMTWMKKILDPRRIRSVQIRNQVEAGIREFFLSQGFLETRTPLLVPCPGMEPHIRPFRVENSITHHVDVPPTEVFLPTSPEFAMKRLLVGGLEKIFQITSSFRNEPISVTHHPEFTMLEWYRAYAGYEEIMSDMENLFCYLAKKIFGRPYIQFQGKEISVQTPWPRLSVRNLFMENTGIDLVQKSTLLLLSEECQKLGLSVLQGETWDDLYFKIWLNKIEPNLPAQQAVFVTRYPASQAALAVVDQDPDGSSWAKRFEAYIGGIELGNAFEELTDPKEQRRRFVEDMNLREEVYGASFPKTPLDEGFLQALNEGMPPSGGIAVGVDRMVMLYANEPDIGYTVWLEPAQ